MTQPTVRWAEARHAVSRKEIVRAAEIIIGTAVTIIAVQAALRYNVFDPALWSVYRGPFLRGVLGTLRFVGIMLPVSVVVGFVLGWARISRYRFLAWPVAVYVNFFRGVPVILIVIFAALIGPGILGGVFGGRDLALNIATIAIALHSSAFQAEIFRAGFQSVPRGQVEAAQAIGMRSSQSMRHIVLPQAMRLSLPPLSNELAVLIKDSSLLAAIGAVDLFGITQDFAQEIILLPGAPLWWILSAWTAVALTYLSLTLATTGFVSWLERRIHVKGLEGVSV